MSLRTALGVVFGLLLMAVLPAAAAAAAPASGYAYYEIGDIHAPTPGRVEGGAMLMGGGDWALDAFRWLARRSGGGHIVVLRASYAGENGEEIYREVGGVASVQTLVFSSRKAASDPRVLDIVRHADGIFLSGGDQSNYVRYWRGTPLNAALDAHVRAGKPIGGASAGLAVLGAYSYGAMDGGSIDARSALKDPLGPQVTLVRDFLHLPWLGEVVTDSHFTQRKRLGRLIAFVARLAHEQNDAQITGIGVDENTALCIDDKGQGLVVSGSGGRAWLVRPLRQADRIAPGRPLSFTGVPVVGIETGGRLDLTSFEVTGPAVHRTAEVRDGVLTVSGD